MDFIGAVPIEINPFIDRIHLLDEKILLRKKWHTLAQRLITTSHNFNLISFKQKSIEIKESVNDMQQFIIRIAMKKWVNRSKWKKMSRLILVKFYKKAAEEYYNLLLKQKLSIRQKKWQRMVSKYLTRKKLLLKGESYRDLINFRQIRKAFLIWGKNIITKRNNERSKWISFAKRIQRIRKNKTFRMIEYHQNISREWKSFSSALITRYNKEQLEKAFYHDRYLQIWKKFTKRLERKAFKAIFSKPLTTKPKWISMIKRISRIKARKNLIKKYNEYVARTIWKEMYDHLMSTNKAMIISQGKKEIKRIHQQEATLKAQQKYFIPWKVLYLRRSYTKKIINDMYRESFNQYQTSTWNQSAFMIQSLFRGNLLLKERKIWRKKIKHLFYRWKSALIFITTFRRSIPTLVQEFSYPQYDLNLPPIPMNFSVNGVIDILSSFGERTKQTLERESQQRLRQKTEHQLDTIAHNTIQLLNIDSILPSFVHVSISPSLSSSLCPSPKTLTEGSQTPTFLNNFFEETLNSAFDQLQIKPNITSLNTFKQKSQILPQKLNHEEEQHSDTKEKEQYQTSEESENASLQI